MDAPIGLAVSLGCLGIKKVASNEAMQEVLKFGLSFILPDSVVDSAFQKLEDKEILREIANVVKKVDLLLGEAQSSSIQLLRDAYIAYEAKNYAEAAQLFKEVRQNAFKAFNHANTLDGWVTCTQLKITSSYMNKSFVHDEGMVLFFKLAQVKQREIAQTIKGYIDDMMEKTGELKKNVIEKAKKGKFGEKKRLEVARTKIQEIDDKVDIVLVRSYPLLSQGLGLTDPNSRIGFGTAEFAFEVFPIYIPEGEEDAVQITVAKRPELVVSLYRSLEFSYKSVDMIEIQILTWTLNNIVHKEVLEHPEKNREEPRIIKINNEELAYAFRGGNQPKNLDFLQNNNRRITISAAPAALTVKNLMQEAEEKKKLKESKQKSPDVTKKGPRLTFFMSKKNKSKNDLKEEAEKKPSSSSSSSSSSREPSPQRKANGNVKEMSQLFEPNGAKNSVNSREVSPSRLSDRITEISRKLENNFERNSRDSSPNPSNSNTGDNCPVCSKTVVGTSQVHALDQKFHPECFKCEKCGTVLVEEFHNREGKPHCASCYENLDCWPICFKCKLKIVPGKSNKKTKAKGNVYHKNCLKCAVCGKALSRDTTGIYEKVPGLLLCLDDFNKPAVQEEHYEPLNLSAASNSDSKLNENNFKDLSGFEERHTRDDPRIRRSFASRRDNMKCDDCGLDIHGTYYQCEGKNICEKDYEASYRKKCSICGDGVSGSYFTDKNGKIICAKDYKAQQGGSLACKKCGQDVKTKEIVRAVESIFHPDCFSCCVCLKNLAKKEIPFLADDDKNIYCREDYNKKFAPRCSGCGEPIAPKPGEKSASRLKALNKDWHPECFKCVDCKDKLGGDGKKCYPMNDLPLCLDCHKIRL